MSTHTSGRAYDHSTSGLVALGTTAFAGVMLATVALFQILEGIAAIGEDSVFVTGLDYVYKLDVTTWGWIHLVVGVIGLATAVGILAAQPWGYVAGIAIATIGAVTNFAFLPFYPFWSIVVLSFNILVIWALCRQLGAAK
ncbi:MULTISPECIES: DUF7144 family membrane protein [unclassified Nocardioides]|uniref:DUF7144 family membrane protein n=1 Tax=unclassified Nocardioides TaxID=2615069 RepID=UPI00301440A7